MRCGALSCHGREQGSNDSDGRHDQLDGVIGDTAFSRAVLNAFLGLCVGREALALHHRQVARHNVVTLVRYLVRCAIVVVLVDLASLRPRLNRQNGISKEAFLAGAREPILDAILGLASVLQILVHLEALGLDSLVDVGTVVRQAARVNALAVEADLVFEAGIRVLIQMAARRPWRGRQVLLPPEVVALIRHIRVRSIVLAMDNNCLVASSVGRVRGCRGGLRVSHRHQAAVLWHERIDEHYNAQECGVLKQEGSSLSIAAIHIVF